MRNIAVILAGGTGSRIGLDKPKQFVQVEGRTLIERSIDAFDAHPLIDEVLVVVHPDWMEYARQLQQQNTWRKVCRIIEGGSERYLSSLNAVVACMDEPDDTNLLFHDAARPWVSQEVIDRVVKGLQQHEAVGVGILSTDTIWEVRSEFDLAAAGRGDPLPKFITRIPERNQMWRAQTPQAFRLPIIRDAYQRALQDSQFHSTDDCGILRRYMPEVKVYVVEGEESNKKVTFAEDLL